MCCFLLLKTNVIERIVSTQTEFLHKMNSDAFALCRAYKIEYRAQNKIEVHRIVSKPSLDEGIGVANTEVQAKIQGYLAAGQMLVVPSLSELLLSLLHLPHEPLAVQTSVGSWEVCTAVDQVLELLGALVLHVAIFLKAVLRKEQAACWQAALIQVELALKGRSPHLDQAGKHLAAKDGSCALSAGIACVA
jgi:hypothetical protein